MTRRTKLHFNHIVRYDSPRPFEGLTFALRTDAGYATATLKHSILDHFNAAADAQMVRSVRVGVHRAYRKWGHKILRALASTLDYDLYDLRDAQNKFLNVHFYNAKSLAIGAVEKGERLVADMRGKLDPGPVLYISLDDMIAPHTEYAAEIAFSRLFSVDGARQLGYQARPGKPSLTSQLDAVREIVKTFHAMHGYKIPVVLLEDNIRHARMLNWVIDLMDQHGIFDDSELAGISTCFCCAPEEERQAIKHRGQTVPLTWVIDYKGARVDVATPRDLLFDGLVVDLGHKAGRLPGPFMDISKVFKIAPDKIAAFENRVFKANIAFCETLEQTYKITLPLKWFPAGDTVAAVTGQSPDTRMVDVLKAAHTRQGALAL